MKPTLLFPYLLAGLLAFSIVGLWAAASFQQTVFVQAFYMVTIFVAFSVFLAALWSSSAYAFKRFHGYWGSGYPTMLAVMLLAYGIYKSAPQLTALAILVGALVAGHFIVGKIPQQLHRFVPLVTVAAFVIVGELPFWRDGKAFVLGICVGLLTTMVVRYRA